MGRNPDPPSALAGPYRRRALPAGPHRRRSPGNPALGSLRATPAVVDKTGFPHPADHRAGWRRPSRRASSLRRVPAPPLPMERATPDALQACLRHLLAEAGALALMTPEVITTLADHAQGNLRS